MKTFLKLFDQKNYDSLLARQHFTIMIVSCLFFLSPNLLFSQNDTPCECAERWNDADCWVAGAASSSCGNGPGAIKGVIGCGNAANTQSNIGPNCTYDPVNGFALPTLTNCIDPSGNTNPSVTPPIDGQQILWFNFDVRPFAGSYEFQVIGGPDDIGWALFYSNSPTVSTNAMGLSGDCNDLTYDQCGINFTGWADSPFTVPNISQATNYYIMVWDQDPTNDYDFSINFKARFGCGDSDIPVCSIEAGAATTSCNGNGTYTVSVPITGINGEYIGTDPNALAASTAVCLTNLADANPTTMGTIELTYNDGVDYNITIAAQNPASGGCTVTTNSASCVTSLSGTAPVCAVACGTCIVTPSTTVCPNTTTTYSVNTPTDCTNPVVTWTVTGDVASFTPNGLSVDVVAAGNCGNYTVSASIACTGCTTSPVICSQNIGIVDNTPPNAPAPPADVNVQCATDVPAPVDLTANDNCDGDITVSPSAVITPGACANEFTMVRTWTFADGCGNSSSVSQTINVNDTTPPNAPAPPVDVNVQCAADVPAPVDLTANDDCDGDITVSPSAVITPGACANEFTMVRTWTFADGCGNSSSVSQTINVNDTTPPNAPTPPADVNVQCATDVPAPVDLTANDNCDGDITVSPSAVITPGACANEFTMVRTWTFADGCGNASSVSQTINVNDTTPPNAPTPPADINVQCATDVPAPVDLTANDNCDGDITVSPSVVITSGDCPNQFTMVRTWTFADGCGNSSSVSQTINVNDTTPPNAPTPPADVNVQCAADVPAPVDLTANDNCDGDITVSPSAVITPGACANEFTMVRTWTFADGCGNSSSVSQTINVNDTTPPNAPAPPADVNVQCAADVPAPVDLTANDDCDGDITVSPSAVITPGACANEFTMVRTWTFADGCGNSSSVSQTINVNDTTPPNAPAPLADVNVQCAADVPAPVDLTANDNCDGDITVSPSAVITPGACANEFTMVRTWTFADGCGNSSSVSQTINVNDTTPPNAPAPLADVNVQCAADVPAPVDLTANDNCDGDITVSPSAVITPGACANEFTMVRTWTFADDCGNSSSVSQTINVNDTTPPNAPTPPATVNVQCAADVPAPVDLTANDNCDGDITVSPSAVITPGACANEFTMVRTWTFTDGCGNSSSVSQTINVNDTTPPNAPTPPATVNVQCAADVPAPVDLTANDNCDGDITVSPSAVITPGACVNEFTMVRTWTFADDCGNSSSVSQTINVNDTTPPNAPTPPADVNVQCAADVPAPVDLTANDNCDGDITVSPSAVITPGACANEFTMVRTWTFADDCGNSSSVSQTINVEDTTPPNAPAPPATVNVQCAADVPAPVDLTANDDCDGDITVSPSAVITPGACANEFTMVRTWTFADGCGNSSSVSQTINVNDTTPPNAPTPPADVNVQCAADVPAPVDLTANDNCDGDITVSPSAVITPGACANEFTMVRTWTFADDCGNSSSVSQTINVNDTTPPNAPAPPADVNVQCAADVPAPVDLTANDNCDGDITVSPSAVITPGACANEFTMVRTWTFADDCGNSSSVSQTINVNDTTPPNAPTPPATVNVQCAADVPAPVDLTANDNCDGDITVSPSAVITPGACANEFTMVRTWTFVDDCGNASSVSQTINVNDTTPPNAPTPPATVNVQCAADVPAPVDLTANDDCDGDITVSPSAVITPGACANEFTMVRTWTFADGCGNSSSVSQTINVNDTTPPNAPAPPVDVNVQCAADVPAPVDLTANDDCDGDITVSPSAVITPGACANEFTMVRTWTFADDCGNSSSVSQTINVNDTTPPNAPTPPATVNVQCAADVPAPVDLTANDNCDGDITVSPSAVITPGACANEFTMVRTWTFADDCGNSSSVSQTINVNDTTPPNAPAPPADVNVQCAADVPAPVDLTANDNCDGDITVSPSAVITPGACANEFTMVRTWTFADGCGNSSSVSQTINVNDTTPPNAPAPPADVNVQCAADVPAPVDLTANDNCDGDITVSPSVVITSGDCPNQFTMVRTWTFTDGCGNSSSVSQTINVNDTTPPNALCKDVTITLNTTLLPALIDNGSFDNCGDDLDYSISQTNFDCDDLGSNAVILSVKDNCGNFAECTSQVTVIDDILPNAVCQDITIQLTQNGIATIQAQDLDGGSSDNCGPVSFSVKQTIFDCDDLGNNQLNLTVTDASGNVSMCTATVSVIDNTPPVTTFCPSDISVEIQDDLCGAFVDFPLPIVESACGNPPLISNFNPGDFFPCGVHNVNFTIEGGQPGAIVCSFLVTITDTDAPEIICPEDITMTSFDNNPVPVDWMPPFISDPCLQQILVNNNYQSGDLFPVGTTEVIYTAIDKSGNIATCTFDITILPVLELNCIEDLDVSTDKDSSIVNWNFPLGETSCELCGFGDLPDFRFLGNFKGHEYYVFEGENLGWFAAQDMAESLNGHLATISDAEENEFIANHFSPQTSAFIGLSDVNNDNEFVWINGDSLNYHNWEQGTASIEDDVDMVVFLGDGTWTTVLPNTTEKFILEIPCVDFTRSDEHTDLVSGDEFPAGIYNLQYEAVDLCGNKDKCDFDVDIAQGIVEYCNSVSVGGPWIANVTVAEFSNSTGDDEGYGDYTNMLIDAQPTDCYFALTPGGVADDKIVYWRIWIDLNQDGDFFDEGETVFEWAGVGTVESFHNLANGIPDSDTRMRVAMSCLGFPEPCADFLDGEVEDYSIYAQDNGDPTIGFDDNELSLIAQNHGSNQQLELPKLNEFKTKELDNLILYPNPANDKIFFRTNTPINGEVRVKIFNSLGVLIEEKPVTINGISYEIELSGYANGIYLMQFLTSDFKTTLKKFVVESTN